MAKKNNHLGHRKRMREDFSKSGFSNWQPHIVLEYLLFYSIPVADTNNLAHEIIKGCGGFVNVFNTPKERLLKVQGVGEKTADYICMLGEFLQYYNRVKYDTDTLELNSKTCENYMLSLFENESSESLYMICLDAQNHILKKKRVAEGSFESMDIDIPTIMRTAINSEAAYVVLAHNHPSGIAEPSHADIVSTQVLERTLHMGGVKLLDHIIVAGRKCVSMRDGYLDSGNAGARTNAYKNKIVKRKNS